MGSDPALSSPDADVNLWKKENHGTVYGEHVSDHSLCSDHRVTLLPALQAKSEGWL